MEIFSYIIHSQTRSQGVKGSAYRPHPQRTPRPGQISTTLDSTVVITLSLIGTFRVETIILVPYYVVCPCLLPYYVVCQCLLPYYVVCQCLLPYYVVCQCLLPYYIVCQCLFPYYVVCQCLFSRLNMFLYNTVNKESRVTLPNGALRDICTPLHPPIAGLFNYFSCNY